MFTGILAYADDIALLAAIPQAMRCMLSVCEKYATVFGVLFNVSKSQCIMCTAPVSKMALDLTNYSKFTISSNEIEFVQSVRLGPFRPYCVQHRGRRKRYHKILSLFDW